ncbi:sugar phosphate nucleotidyltransferase [Isoptericola sp. BMS4]|uniref:sugar phosphate nucleotidyltransferase n=1 Tax=Isoptericola sp. BMS4 TaxID=2527875 RepID=UPI00196AC1FC|nr:sugar phosphate nucleotidyltransferase [Isoptericola sp. BMS4]
MKVVLFCGGLGMRMRSGPDSLPKPMMPIGSRPVLWHIMKYYAHFGHTEFVLALGYGATAVKDYFLDYRETHSNDFVLSEGGARVELLSSDISDWRITFVDTGADTAIGERLRRVRPYLDGDDVFLANYGDVLTDAPLDRIVDDFVATSAVTGDVGTLLAVDPQDSFHVVKIDPAGHLTGIEPVADMEMRINGGYFVLRQGIFDYLDAGDDLVMDGCVRAAHDGRFRAVRYDGFWAPMDTLKERSALEELYRTGRCPWAVWRDDGRPAAAGRRVPVVDLPDVADRGAAVTRLPAPRAVRA